MTLDLAQAIIAAAESDGIEMTLLEDYSGRGMHGKTTAAIECRSREDLRRAVCRAMDTVKDNGTDLDDEIYKAFRDAKSDNLGRNIIIY